MAVRARLCVEAVLASTVVPEEEYENRIGCDRHRLEAIIREWPPSKDGDQNSEEFLAVNNCLSEVGYCLEADPWESELHRHVTRDEAELVSSAGSAASASQTRRRAC